MSFRILGTAFAFALATSALATGPATKPAAKPAVKPPAKPAEKPPADKVAAPAPSDKGPSADELAQKGLGSSFAGLQQGYAEMTMVTTSASKVEKSRTLSFSSMRDSHGMLLYLLRFLDPVDVRGTAFLVRENKGGLPSQYMYMPAAGKVTEVAAGKATASFFGSDFIYADLLPYPADKGMVELKRLEDKDLNGDKAYVLQVGIKDQRAPYSRIVATIRVKDMVPMQVEFFDRANNKALKTLSILDFDKKAAKPTPSKFEMKNVQTGSKTVITVDKTDPTRKFKEDEFTKDALRS